MPETLHAPQHVSGGLFWGPLNLFGCSEVFGEFWGHFGGFKVFWGVPKKRGSECF